MIEQSQLEHVIKLLRELPFAQSGDAKDHQNYPTGMKSFSYLNADVPPLLTHYYGHKHEDNIHCYVFTEDHSIILAETRSFYDRKSGNVLDTLVAISELFYEEYVSTRQQMIKILGDPTYLNDRFFEFAIWNYKTFARHETLFSEFGLRRDVPLEIQMVKAVADQLTYWNLGERVVYLTLGQEDKEEPVTITIGSRPLEGDLRA